LRFPFLCLLSLPLFAQGNYEVQVYGSDTVEPHNTMVELHSNFTFQGTKSVVDGQYPTEHQLHETLEITHGFTDWFETGWYVFSSAGPGQGWQWVGDHIRPRVRIPEKWKWPVGLSLSNEIGYQRAVFSADTWTWEIRPIIDKKLGKWYWSFNPTFDRSFPAPASVKGSSSRRTKPATISPRSHRRRGYYGALGGHRLRPATRTAAADRAGHRQTCHPTGNSTLASASA
jgi:hypothetical protein